MQSIISMRMKCLLKILLLGLLAWAACEMCSCANNNCFGPIPSGVQSGHNEFTASLAKP